MRPNPDDVATSPKTVAAIRRASEGDRRWFKQHRDRAHRLRPAINGEFPGSVFPRGARRLALVKQITVGSRARLPMWVTQPVCDCEKCLAGMWEHFAPPRFRTLSLDIAAASLRARR